MSVARLAEMTSGAMAGLGPCGVMIVVSDHFIVFRTEEDIWQRNGVRLGRLHHAPLRTLKSNMAFL